MVCWKSGEGPSPVAGIGVSHVVSHVVGHMFTSNLIEASVFRFVVGLVSV